MKDKKIGRPNKFGKREALTVQVKVDELNIFRRIAKESNYSQSELFSWMVQQLGGDDE